MTTPKFTPRFDVYQAQLDRFQLLLDRDHGLVGDTPRADREVALDRLKAQARADVDERARVDIQEQEAAHAQEQAQRIAAIETVLAPLAEQAGAVLNAFDVARKTTEGVTDEAKRKEIGLRLATLLAAWRREITAR